MPMLWCLPRLIFFHGLHAQGSAYTANQIIKFKGGLNPKGLYNENNYTFTAPYECDVKMEVSCSLYSTATGLLYVYVCKRGAAFTGLIFQVSHTYGNQHGAGFHVVSCLAGETLDVRTTYATNINSGNIINTIL